MSEPERVGEIIGGQGSRPLKGRKRKLELLKINWRSIAGEEECRHSSPTRLSRRTLTVATDGPSWAAELSIRTKALLRGVEAVIGEEEVQKIKVQARSTGSRCKENEANTTGKEESSAEEGRIELSPDLRSGLESVRQEETRAALERLLKASVASKQGKRGAR